MNEDFPWDDLLDAIERGQVVPVVGDELLETEYQGRRVTLPQVIAEEVARREKLTVRATRHSELNDVASAYLMKPRATPDTLRSRIRSVLDNLNPPFPVPEALTQLAGISRLDLFVSLTFDSLLADAIDRVRFGGSLRTNRIGLSLNQSSEDQAEALATKPGEPVVLNLFGRPSKRGIDDFAIHDEDALEFVHRLANEDVAGPEWLLSELRNRHLLILGVHLPDWLERFVLRATTRDRLWKAQRVYFVAGESASTDLTLLEFVRLFGGRDARTEAYEGRAAEFVAELERRWVERHPKGQAVEAVSPDAAKASIFISYGRESLPAVERLHQAITDLGGDAWFDRSDLTPGDLWERQILPQIQRDTKLFVPVISAATAAKSEGYVFREWKEAIERAKRINGGKFIVPVVVDANYTGDLSEYSRLLDTFPAFRDLHLGRAPNGEPDEALRKALIEEIREIRRKQAQ